MTAPRVRLELSVGGGRTNMRPVSSTTAPEAIAAMEDMLADAEGILDEIQAGGIAGGYAGAPPGTVFDVAYDEDTGWPERPTARPDIRVYWTGGDEAHPPGSALQRDKWDRPAV